MNQRRLPPCRLYALVAASADVALVFRRGPTGWWHLLHWDLSRLTLKPGAWFHGNLYPRRSEISPDGRLLAYFARKTTRRSPWPEAYCAVARAPWLEALTAWKTGGTWTWGCEFTPKGQLCIQACIDPKPIRGQYPGSVTFAPMGTDWPRRDVWNEIKRGWRVAKNDDPMAASGQSRPHLVLRRRQPAGGRATLGMIHQGVDFRRPGIEGVQLEYFLQDRPGDIEPLADAVWTSWDHQGRLLMATRGGALAVYDCQGTNLTLVWSEDLRDRSPNPQSAPAWASRW